VPRARSAFGPLRTSHLAHRERPVAIAP
jgi:hypothetical protein